MLLGHKMNLINPRGVFVRKINLCKLNSKRAGQAGFSLVELMVVVAIIGVLATLAIPNVSKFLAKARQSEAKTQLSAVYSAEKAFFAEYTAYHGMFGAIGYSPEGQLRYNVGFAAAPSEANVSNGYNSTPAAPGNVRSAQAYCGVAGAILNGCSLLNGATNVAAPAVPALGILNSTAGTFTVAAAARIVNTAGGVDDNWTMTQDKVLTNSQNGIR